MQSIGAYSYVGCYTEATTGRALSGKTYANDNMTVEICYAQCVGFTWFGLEYHRECESFPSTANWFELLTDHFLAGYCGNAPNVGSALYIDHRKSM